MTPDVQRMKLLTKALDHANAAARALNDIDLSGAPKRLREAVKNARSTAAQLQQAAHAAVLLGRWR